ncbi:MAG: hypothetical protein AAGJ87_15795, partial [Pseudomonadota bacterium]
FVPIFDGPSEASETVLHTMASGASVGLSLEGSTITDRFFSERSAVRIAVAEEGKVKTEEQIFSKRRPGRIKLKELDVPNTIVEGQNAAADIEVDALVVEGNIDVVGEVDSYTFRGRAGEFFNAELVSVIGEQLTFEEGIIGQLRLFQIDRDGTETLIASNFQSFESVFDSEIFDAVLPVNGLYRIEVSAPDEFFPFGDETPFPLSAAGGGDLLTGQYSLLAFTCVKELDDDDDDDDDVIASNDDDDDDDDEADDD